eukprot:INCI4618.1.p1 GENE.INCI4618.1~~INCI4618.1.p1  ORF type:complete len:708 (-),score=111.55 INCI4618.1:644-2767(-)
MVRTLRCFPAQPRSSPPRSSPFFRLFRRRNVPPSLSAVSRNGHRGPRHHPAVASLVALSALLMMATLPLAVQGKVITGSADTSSCQHQMGVFDYGIESEAAANLVISVDVPEEMNDVWLFALMGAFNSNEGLPLTCYEAIDLFTKQAEVALELPAGSAADFLSYSTEPDFPNTAALLRLNNEAGTLEAVTRKYSEYNISAVQDSCTLAGRSVANLHNGLCDDLTNIAACDWDGGDCCEQSCVCVEPRCAGVSMCGTAGYNCRDSDSFDDGSCDCCPDAAAAIGYNSFLIRAKIAQFQRVNLFLMNVDLASCKSQSSPFPYCHGPLMNITYRVEFLNAVAGSVWAHLSSNDAQLLQACFAMTPLYILPVALAVLISRELKKLEKYHWTARFLMYSIYLGFAAQLAWLVDLVLVSATGTGAVVANENGANIRIFQVVGLLVFFLADSLMLLVGVSLAKGWSIVRRKLSARSRIIYGCMLALYILSCETAVVWNAATLLTLDEENTIFNSDPGYLVAAIRMLLYLGFVWAFSTTLRKFKSKRGFFIKLFILFSVWILFQTLVGFFVTSSGVCYALIGASMFATQLFFLLMFWPNQKFNSGFPFHIRTSQMDDSAERIARQELDKIKSGDEERSGPVGEDGVSEETRQRMDEIRAATNPLTRSRVILQKMQGDIGNLMMFSTELGRALEEMQTKDDDPESGEEVRQPRIDA